MEPSALEIRREVEALRDIRRRSSSQGGPGSLPLDPDLPNAPPSPPSPLSPQTWAQQPGSSEKVSQDDEDHVLADPSHLFWVPAHLHPELAPAEFRVFLQQHARNPETAPAAQENAHGQVGRSSSLRSNSSLNRRRSMLSRQYEPQPNDGVERQDDTVKPDLQRKRSRAYGAQSPQLSISDLQKLEELAEEASRSDDPSKLRSVLRRSLSLNVPPSKLEDQMPDIEDADAPIIVPKPGQILRRAARTKIRKPSLQGDGGGHRFPATRRTQRSATLDSLDAPLPDRTSTTTPTQDDPYPRPHAPLPGATDEDEDASRPVSFSEESLIFDSYADRPDSYTSVSEEDHPTSSASPPPSLPPLHYQQQPLPQPVVSPPPQQPPQQPQLHEEPEQLQPQLYHPTPQRMLAVPGQQGPSGAPARSPSPGSSDGGHGYLQPSPSPPPGGKGASPRKDKEKKGGLFSKWGSGKESKKAKDAPQHQAYSAPPKEKESSGFFGLFGGKKKADESSFASGAGPAAAAALLGPPKSKSPHPGQQGRHGQAGSTGFQYGAGGALSGEIQYAGNYARYPIHVERAVYRLSHIKLANPRRPLYEQVLISNLMFWYLGVINKQQQAAAAAQAQMQAQMQQQDGQMSDGDAEREERERREAEEQEAREREEHERQERLEWEHQQQERERLQREQEEQEVAAAAAAAAQTQRKKSGRRAALTKSTAGSPRRAEMPVRGPQYDAQHRVLAQEQWDSLGMGLNAHDVHGNSTAGYPSMFEQPKEPVASLPPGAMSPAHALEASGRRSPPTISAGSGVSRSLSAGAVAPGGAPLNGRPRRKANSAIAARAGAGAWRQDDDDERFFGGAGGAAEEDVPLAVWQQQQRTAAAGRR
ncbi:hypothetical protein EXIGLDRAFT_718987 [Exidia glandulosa HHB12029]|uniref:Protein Zds1 C-terminal domain-containing protein n=1 Tax=Exidia glandulosa HHB12029 TaxID=1314781 RepID=A0A165NUL2_EXIGL|nr:hypothetical protein EXIGLDRAFT_718987 [Exidia glandulosa HHB12029]